MLNSAQELVAVVDNNDVVVAAQPRSLVHQAKMCHRAVHVVVVNSSREVFLQKRSQFKEVAPGLWDSSAAGHVNYGEDYLDCAYREFSEELGLVPDRPLQPLFKLEPNAETGWEFVWVYLCYADGPFRLDPQESETGAWFSPPTLDNLVAKSPELFGETFKLIWHRICLEIPEIVT